MITPVQKNKSKGILTWYACVTDPKKEEQVGRIRTSLLQPRNNKQKRGQADNPGENKGWIVRNQGRVGDDNAS